MRAARRVERTVRQSLGPQVRTRFHGVVGVRGSHSLSTLHDPPGFALRAHEGIRSSGSRFVGGTRRLRFPHRTRKRAPLRRENQIASSASGNTSSSPKSRRRISIIAELSSPVPRSDRIRFSVTLSSFQGPLTVCICLTRFRSPASGGPQTTALARRSRAARRVERIVRRKPTTGYRVEDRSPNRSSRPIRVARRRSRLFD